MTRIGLFGSSFDPPHSAHLSMARLALGWGLDAIWWIPAALPPHKQQHVMANSWDRHAMAVLATLHESQMRVESLELERGGISYTIDTLRALHAAHSETEWFLMMGEDTWLTLGSWYAIDEFPALTNFMVFGRADLPAAAPHPFPDLPAVVRFPAFDMPLSSRAIREQIQQGDARWRSSVTAEVADYIQQQGLYGVNEERDRLSASRSVYAEDER